MSNSLTALDATFLELEQLDEGATMHIGGVMVFDPLPDGTVPALEAVCTDIASRLTLLPRYSQRQCAPTPTNGLIRLPAASNSQSIAASIANRGFFSTSARTFSLTARRVNSIVLRIQPYVTSSSACRPTVGATRSRHSRSVAKWMGVRMAAGVLAVSELIHVGSQSMRFTRRSVTTSAMPMPTALS